MEPVTSRKKLPRTAYELRENEVYVPYTHGQTLPEFTVKAAITGILLGVLFGAANTYLGLKAGLTISTSIPVAVLTVVVFRALSLAGGSHSILEANLSQTIGSASSSVASGALFTLPALFMWGMDPQRRQLTLLSMAGGLLGVLAMIPLRSFLIKNEHGNLPYPEGMACAEVLVAAEAGGRQASGVFAGIGAGMLFKLLTDGFKIVPDKLQVLLPFPPKGVLAVGVSPALAGVGYILGMRVASVMVAGAALSSFVLIPIIYLWGRGFDAPCYPETTKLIAQMSPHEMWDKYVRYVGAGAVATGGIITLLRSIPTMVESFKLGLAQISAESTGEVERTDRDLSMRTVLMWIVGIVLVLALVPGILGTIDSYAVRGVAAVLAAVFAFFFVTVAARIVGLVGQTSNPISGMTIASLLGTSLIFYFLGWTDRFGQATALMVGTVICIAASIAGDTSQDLKTGFILGATPRRQQIGELIGVITSAGVVCYVLMLLDESPGLGSADLPAPQGTLMMLVIEGVLNQSLPWPLIGIGSVIGIAAFLAGVPVLAFAVGVYLPLSTMATIFVGGLLRWVLTTSVDEVAAERRRERGILFGSGLVGGGGLTGVLLAMWVVMMNGGEKIEGFSARLEQLPPWGIQLVAAGGVVALAVVMGIWICATTADDIDDGDEV